MLNHLGTGFLAAVLTLPPAFAASNLEFSMEEAIEVMRAAGTVLGTESGLERAARDCGEHHLDLARPGRQALDAWATRNELMLQRSRQLSDLVLQALAERSGNDFAAHMRQRLHEDADQQARELAATVDAESPEDRHYLCTRLFESISRGEWDFGVENPGIYEVLARDYAPD